LPTEDRFTHIQAIGSTGSGKTFSVFYPSIFQDIRNGAGVFIFDIKSNMKDTIIKFVTENKANRDLDFMCFSLGDPSSHTYNPLAGDNAGEIANRAFSALYYEGGGEPFYVDSQRRFLFSAISVLLKKRGTIIFEDLYKATVNPALYFKQTCAAMGDDPNAKYLLEKLKNPDLPKILTGLINRLAAFVTPSWAPQINTRTPDIDVAELVTKNKILLFQANSGVFSQDYKPLSILMMMHLQAEISKRYEKRPEVPFFIYLDEFYNILYPEFPELINKAREARVGLIFGHQSLGDLERYGNNVKNIILTNSRNKIILNIEDPMTAEYYAKAWGTDTIQKSMSSYSTKSGMQESGLTIREEEAFIIHPNEFKYLKLGEGYVKLETKAGKIIRKVKFTPIDYSKLKTHTLHIAYKKKVTPAPETVFEEEKEVVLPPVSMKKKFSMKEAAKNAPTSLKEALKRDIGEQDE
jgi:type IV secretory pathway TraG/TraD family ATPase VirD4